MNHIIFLKSDLNKAGGIEKNSLRLLRYFASKGHRLTLLTSSFNAEKFPLNIEVINFSLPRIFSFRRLLAFDQLCTAYLARTSFDAVLGLDRNSFQTHLRAGNGIHAAYLDHRRREESFLRNLSFSVNPLHQSILSIEKASFTHPLLKRAIVNSHMVKQEAIRYYGIDSNKVAVLHNGVEWEEMSNDFLLWQEKKFTFAKEHSLDADLHHFLFVGNNFKRKGLHKLLQALALLKEREIHLSVVGKDKESAEFKKLAKSLGLEKKVSFFGPRSDIRSFYQLADTLVIPSLYDPFSNVTLEALAMGLFVVSSKGNGGHEILTLETGAVIESLNELSAIASTLQHALKQKKNAKSASMIRESVKKFDFSLHLEKFSQLL